MLKLTLALALTAATVAASTATGTVDSRDSRNAAGELAPTSSCRPGSPTELRCLHNYARKVNGLPLLQPVTTLYRAAAIKADRIIECGQFTHSPCGDPWTLAFDEAGYQGGSRGENLAGGYPTIRHTFAGWLNSPGHRGNILNASFRHYGSGYRPSFPRLWVVALGG